MSVQNSTISIKQEESEIKAINTKMLKRKPHLDDKYLPNEPVELPHKIKKIPCEIYNNNLFSPIQNPL
jgi:hypothetical protein